MISIVFLALLLAASAGPCAPKFLLPSTIHDSVKIYSFNASSGATRAAFTYVFLQSLFGSPPQAVLSISEMVASQIIELNYQLSSELKTNNLNLNFASRGMNWTSIQVQFLLYGGKDIASRAETITIRQGGKEESFSFQAETAADASGSFVFSHFITGVVAPASAQYRIALSPIAVDKSQYSLVASANAPATLTIQTLYFDSQQKDFAYAVNEFSLSGSQQPQQRAMWAQFAPTIYTLFGFSLLQFSGDALSISATFDEVGSLFTIGGMVGVSAAKMSYFSIGVLPSTICTPCNNFIAIYGCLDTCPNNSYPENLNGGGKTCRSCNSTLGMSLNPQLTGCSCPNGQQYSQGNCYAQASAPPSCAASQILINNQCVSTVISAQCSQEKEYYDTFSSSCLCVADHERVSGQCVPSCPPNSARDSGSGICVCAPGFLMNALNACLSICPANSFFDASNTCICNQNFQKVNGACAPCGQNEAYDQSSRTCVAKFVGKAASGAVVSVVCEPNEVIVNGICQCNQNSIKFAGKCTPCPPSTFKVAASNQCGLCPTYCLSCQAATSCNECNKGFQVNGQECTEICGDGKKFILACDDGNTRSGDGCSSTCEIEPGYACNGGNATHPDSCRKLKADAKISISIRPGSPVYISTAIITEFVVQPPVHRSREELHNLFSMSFSNDRARPLGVRFSQGDDLTAIRCFFDYNGNLPNDIFNVVFGVRDPSFGSSSVTIMYNSFVNPVKAAVSFLNEAEDDLLE